MKKKAIIVIIIVSCVLLLISIIIVANNTNLSKDKIDEEKITAEIKYLEEEIINLFEIYQDYYENNNREISWNEAENKISTLYDSWNTIILDLNALDIKPENLTSFGQKLDTVMVFNQQKQVKKCMQETVNLYGLLPNYLEDQQNTSIMKNTFICKYYLLKSCFLLDTNNWTLINENINGAIQAFYQNITVLEDKEKEEYQLQKTYVALNELKSSLIKRDKLLFYKKYKMVLEDLKEIRGA